MKNTIPFLIIFLFFYCTSQGKENLSREELEHYLRRSINMQNMWDIVEDSVAFQNDLHFLERIKPAFIGRAAGIWGGGWNEHRIFLNASIIEKNIHSKTVHNNTILQAAVLEAVFPDIDIVDTNYSDGSNQNLSGILVPAYVQQAFGIPFEPGMRFRFSEMIYDTVLARYDPQLARQGIYRLNASYIVYFDNGGEVVDMSKLQSRMLFYYRATRFIDLGYEAIHFGQVEIMDRQDPTHSYWWDLLSKVRAYARLHARRGFVLCDAHTFGKYYNGEGKVNTQLLFDFHSWPIRMQEIKRKGTPEFDCRIAVKPSRSSDLVPIYTRSRGGISPMGWSCEHLPYLVEFDNTGYPLPKTGKVSGAQFVWGWDEISWFANPDRSEESRNKWLIYAWKKIKKLDSAGFLEIPGRNSYFTENKWPPKTYTAYPHQESTILYLWKNE